MVGAAAASHSHNYAGADSAGGAANAVKNYGSATENALRPIWFSDSDNDTHRVHDDNFKYNPEGNVVTCNISGTANYTKSLNGTVRYVTGSSAAKPYWRCLKIESAQNMSLSDIAAVTKDNDNWGGAGGWIWIIVLFLFMYGNGWNRNATTEQPVTEAGLCNAMNFNNLENSVGRMSDLMQTQFMQTSQGLASVGYENLRNFASTQDAIKDGNYALSSQLANCCCENKQATADLKYSAAMNTASINENTTAQTQKILDALAQNKIESLQAQVSELKTQNMFCGVPRISPYGYGVVPNFATPCGCGCNGATF